MNFLKFTLKSKLDDEPPPRRYRNDHAKLQRKQTVYKRSGITGIGDKVKAKCRNIKDIP